MSTASTRSLPFLETVVSPRLVVLTLGGDQMCTSWGRRLLPEAIHTAIGAFGGAGGDRPAWR